MMEEARQNGDMEMLPDIMVNSPKCQQVYKEYLEIGLRDDGLSWQIRPSRLPISSRRLLPFDTDDDSTQVFLAEITNVGAPAGIWVQFYSAVI
jgi:hypothetical protein